MTIENQTEQALPSPVAVQHPAMQPQVAPPVPQAPPEEKLLKQSEVNDLVIGAKQKGFQKGYEQALNEGSQKQAPAVQPLSSPQMTQQQMEDMATQKVAAEFQKHRVEMETKALEAQMQQKLSEIGAKVAARKDALPDFDKHVGAVDFSRQEFFPVLHQANTVENTADVIYELAKNPAKLGAIAHLQGISPSLAYMEIKKLSDSIKANQEGANRQLPNDPLSQVKPSNIGADTGKMNLKDLKKASYLRG